MLAATAAHDATAGKKRRKPRRHQRERWCLRGLFCLSRSVGILARAWEQTCQGGRNQGPIPRKFLWTYDGAPRRDVP